MFRVSEKLSLRATLDTRVISSPSLPQNFFVYSTLRKLWTTLFVIPYMMSNVKPVQLPRQTFHINNELLIKDLQKQILPQISQTRLFIGIKNYSIFNIDYLYIMYNYIKNNNTHTHTIYFILILKRSCSTNVKALRNI